MCVCVVVTFILIVNSDIVLGRIAQFYLKRLCAYNPDHWERKKKIRRTIENGKISLFNWFPIAENYQFYMLAC